MARPLNLPLAQVAVVAIHAADAPFAVFGLDEPHALAAFRTDAYDLASVVMTGDVPEGR